MLLLMKDFSHIIKKEILENSRCAIIHKQDCGHISDSDDTKWKQSRVEGCKTSTRDASDSSIASARFLPGYNIDPHRSGCENSSLNLRKYKVLKAIVKTFMLIV